MDLFGNVFVCYCGAVESRGRSVTVDQLVRQLKIEGPQTTVALAERLGISVQAVRQHVRKLAGDGTLAMTELRGSVGRPARRWSLTPRGHRRFPDAHAEMTANLIASVRATFGEAGLEAVVRDRYQASLAKYRDRMGGADSLSERLQRLSVIRSEEGYMAHIESDSRGYLFVESHCPICTAAEACQGFCSNELRLFREVLGDGVDVDRSEYLIAGDRRCTYRIRRRTTTAA